MSGILGTIGAIGTALSPVTDFVGTMIQNHQNKQLQQQQYNNELDMWNKQNAYNTPANQMQRFRDAGLNPNLIYSQGNPGNAAAAPTAAPAHMENTLSKTGSDSLSMLQNYQDWKVKQVNIDNVRAQTALTQQQQANAKIDQALKNVSLAQNQFNYSQSTKLGQNQLDMAAQNLRQATINANLGLQNYEFNSQNNPLRLANQELNNKLVGQNIQNSQLQNGVLSAQTRGLQINNMRNMLNYNLEHNLKPFGLTTNDASWIRVLMTGLSKAGFFSPHFK